MEISNFSAWHNVDLVGLVDDNYENSEMDICMDKTVAQEIFNCTCLVPFPASFSVLKSNETVIAVSFVTFFALATVTKSFFLTYFRS